MGTWKDREEEEYQLKSIHNAHRHKVCAHVLRLRHNMCMGLWLVDKVDDESRVFFLRSRASHIFSVIKTKHYVFKSGGKEMKTKHSIDTQNLRLCVHYRAFYKQFSLILCDFAQAAANYSPKRYKRRCEAKKAHFPNGWTEQPVGQRKFNARKTEKRW